MSEHMPSKHRSKHISDNMSTHMSECISEHVSEHMSCRPIKHLGVCASAVVHSEKVVPGLQCKPVAESVRACVRACVRAYVRACALAEAQDNFARRVRAVGPDEPFALGIVAIPPRPLGKRALQGQKKVDAYTCAKTCL